MNTTSFDSEKKIFSPVIICGMHRSGTSLVAQILESSGLFLGNKDELLSSTRDNPSGYWEFRDIVRFSDRLLESLGGSWKNISPLLLDSWLSNVNLSENLNEAAHILYPLQHSGKIWGWKDPRSTIMIPFWRHIYPNFKLIVCIRNPLEVAFSLSKRTLAHVDFLDGLQLWSDYHKLLNRDIGQNKVHYIHYEKLMKEPYSEIKQLFNFVGLEPTDDNINNAKRRIKSDLRRGVLPNELLMLYEDLPDEIIEIYQDLCRKANFKFLPPNSDTKSTNQKHLLALEKLLRTSTKTFDLFFKLLEEQRNNNIIKNERITKLNSIIINHKSDTLGKEAVTKDPFEIIDELNQKIIEKDQEILFYATSKSWQITRPLRKIRSFLRKNLMSNI